MKRAALFVLDAAGYAALIALLAAGCWLAPLLDELMKR